jgi:hypothetical protein
VEDYPDTLPSSTGNGPPTTGGPNPPKTT